MSRAEDLVGQHNLPEDLSSLIGRDRDLAEVSGLVGSHRVVTLVGVGGVGKTRLALALARAAVQHFPDGIWLVELGSIIDAGLVPVVVATSVGIAIRPRQPVTETLIAAVGTVVFFLSWTTANIWSRRAPNWSTISYGLVPDCTYWLQAASRSACLARSPGRWLHWLHLTMP